MLPDEQATGEAGAVETTTTQAAPEAAVSSQEQGGAEAERNWDAEAREQGWVPEAEFKGNKRPAKFLDAKEFVERGEHILPIIKQERAKLDKEYGERFAKLEKVTNRTIEGLKAQHEKELAGLKEQREVALDKGDGAAVRKIEKQIEAHEKTAPEIDKPVEAKTDNKATETSWIEKNDWYTSNKTMRGFAIAHSQEIASPDLPMAENLRLTEEAVRKEFPLHFAKSGANGHAPVDGGGSQRNTTTDPLAKLPAEARAQAEKDMKAYPQMYPNAKAWVAAYNS